MRSGQAGGFARRAVCTDDPELRVEQELLIHENLDEVMAGPEIIASLVSMDPGASDTNDDPRDRFLLDEGEKVQAAVRARVMAHTWEAFWLVVVLAFEASGTGPDALAFSAFRRMLAHSRCAPIFARLRGGQSSAFWATGRTVRTCASLARASRSPGHSARTSFQSRSVSTKSPRSAARAARLRRVR